MNEDYDNQADAIVRSLRWHPRVGYQGFGEHAPFQVALRETFPPLVPFGPDAYYGIIPILDWDHRLPSQAIVLRVYTYYSEETFRAGEAQFETRAEQIVGRDKFPEFDVPDFVGITADEAYEGEVTLDGRVEVLRLASAWRREIEVPLAQEAVRLVRESEEFQRLLQTTQTRPEFLGDLEAVSWTPPCESAYSAWTLDVWYLTELNAAMGKGRSFLVDPEDQRVVGMREFVVRSA